MSSDILHSDDDENISGEEDEDYKLWKQEQIRLDEQFEQTAAELERSWIDKSTVLNSCLISPIHDAAAKGNLEMLKELLNDSKVNMDLKDSVDNTPLHWASGAGRTEVVKWLLDNNADINAVNLMGDSSLHRAVWRGHIGVVHELLKFGIDTNIVNKQGHKAIDLVRDYKIGSLIQSYEPLEEEDIEKFYEMEGFSDSDDDNDESEPFVVPNYYYSEKIEDLISQLSRKDVASFIESLLNSFAFLHVNSASLSVLALPADLKIEASKILHGTELKDCSEEQAFDLINKHLFDKLNDDASSLYSIITNDDQFSYRIITTASQIVPDFTFHKIVSQDGKHLEEKVTKYLGLKYNPQLLKTHLQKGWKLVEMWLKSENKDNIIEKLIVENPFPS